VHDAGCVCLSQGFADLDDRIHGFCERQATTLEQQAIEAEPVEPLHHHVGRAAAQPPDIDDLRHVLALDARRRTTFLQQSRDDARFLRELGAQHLDRDRPLQIEVRRREHDAHAAHAEHALDVILVVEQAARLEAGEQMAEALAAVFELLALVPSDHAQVRCTKRASRRSRKRAHLATSGRASDRGEKRGRADLPQTAMLGAP
jgi:hypothetical protein